MHLQLQPAHCSRDHRTWCSLCTSAAHQQRGLASSEQGAIATKDAERQHEALGERTLSPLPKIAPVLTQRREQDWLLHGDVLENILQTDCPIEPSLCPGCSQASYEPPKACAIAVVFWLCHAGSRLGMAWVRSDHRYCRE